MPHYFIKTYGCQMNKNDSERLARVFERFGFEPTEKKEKTDIFVVNSCCVRKNAEAKALGYIAGLKRQKRKNPGVKVIFAGCVSAQPGFSLNMKHVDLILGPNQPEKLEEYLKALTLSLDLRSGHPSPRGRGKEGEGSSTQFITIMHGCDNFCSYCIVPHVRGREVSRPVEDILEEIKQIDFSKQKEIFLLGQNVNSYKYGLANLLRQLDALMPRCLGARIAFMTSHPRDMSDEIINAVADIPSICQYFHLPIQHGDDLILEKMNRGYTIEYYRHLVQKIRDRIPEAAITSDIIVGFPGETEEQFENSIKAIREFRFDTVNTTIYSKRSGTPAAQMEGQVSESIKKERLQRIMKVVNEVAGQNNQRLEGRVVQVLVDQNNAGTCVGRTPTQKIIKFRSKDNLRGQVVSVKITKAKSFVLEGEIQYDNTQ